MNINLKIVLPLVNLEGNKQKIRVDSNLLLQPLYATENDIVPTFNEVLEDTNLPMLRKILFNASITVSRKTGVLDKLKLEPEEIFMIRRDYTICIVNYQYALQLTTNSIKGSNTIQSKSLGDFSVTLSSKNTLKDALSPIQTSAKDCIAEMEKTLREIEQTRIFPKSFVKGSKNFTNIQANDRLWWLKEYGGFRENYATDKLFFRGNAYKTVDPFSLKYNPIDYYTYGGWYDSRHTPRSRTS